MGEANFYYFTCLKNCKNLFRGQTLKTFKNDEAYPKSRNHRKVCDALRCVAQKDCQEDGGVATRHLHLPLLRQGRIEETGRWDLALQRMPKNDRRRCVDPLYHGRGYRQKRHSPSSRNQRTSIISSLGWRMTDCRLLGGEVFVISLNFHSHQIVIVSKTSCNCKILKLLFRNINK